jgi:large subunit ribosomal protein L17
MRHSVFGRQLSRNTGTRKRLFTVLVRNLFIRDAIVTTVAKARAIQPIVEKLVTRAKRGSVVDKRHIIAVLGDKSAASRLLTDAKKRFASRTSGYTRIIKLGRRASDASDMVKFSFVDERAAAEVVKPASASSDAKAKGDKKATAGRPKVKKSVKKTGKK